MRVSSTPWFFKPATVPRASQLVRLYCFSHAGGSAALYRPWQAAISPDIEIRAVQLPGRGARWHETSYTDWHPLVDELATVIAHDATSPFAFFGHSMGGLLAFEVTRELRRRHKALPMHLFVSGGNAPVHRDTSRRWHELPDAQLLEVLREFGGTTVEMLDNAEMMGIVLPIIRADFSLFASYRYAVEAPLALPITVFAGTRDRHLTPAFVERWRDETSELCEIDWFDGDHFFIDPHRQALLARIAGTLTEHLKAEQNETTGR